LSFALTEATPETPAPRYLAARLRNAQFVGMWGAFFILASAIMWTAWLHDPAGAILALIVDLSDPVLAGYPPNSSTFCC